MANCNKCLHYELCRAEEACLPDYVNCNYFEDRNRFVELTCKVGDVVYSYCEDLFRILPYFIEQIIISYDSDSHNNEYVTFIGISSNASELLDDMDFTVDEIGKTVFLTREEAEQAIKERENK